MNGESESKHSDLHLFLLGTARKKLCFDNSNPSDLITPRNSQKTFTKLRQYLSLNFLRQLFTRLWDQNDFNYRLFDQIHALYKNNHFQYINHLFAIQIRNKQHVNLIRGVRYVKKNLKAIWRLIERSSLLPCARTLLDFC